jgi:cytochrome c oxidase accessory protein FixG
MNASPPPPLSDQEPPAGDGLLSLFAKRVKVYPAQVAGRYRRLKWLLLALFLTIYYFVPFLRWDRGPYLPDQAVLVDIPGRKFYFFFFEVWPQEVFVFTGLLLLAAFALFFVTSIVGRVWCGFACPQTVWTDLYLFVERVIEGDRNSRMRLDKAPWTGAKIVKKAIKHVLWILIALCTGGAWVLYFTDAPALVHDLLSLKFSFASTFWIVALTLSTYTMAGFAREQVCTYMCPYARFQGAMYDENTLLVTYDQRRGEPRGKVKRDGTGDCVDCLRCVAVCPVGIDIRNGQQYQCINCGLCVDACNDIMAKLDRPPGLIRFDTLTHVSTGRNAARFFDIFNIRRPRPLIYGTIISIVGLVLLYTLTMGRSLLDMNIIRERSPMFIKLSDGAVRNVYTVHVVNKTHEMNAYTLSTQGQKGTRLSISESPVAAGESLKMSVRPDQVGTFRLFVDVPRAGARPGSTPIVFEIKGAGKSDRYETTFVAPEEE